MQIALFTLLIFIPRTTLSCFFIPKILINRKSTVKINPNMTHLNQSSKTRSLELIYIVRKFVCISDLTRYLLSYYQLNFTIYLSFEFEYHRNVLVRTIKSVSYLNYTHSLRMVFVQLRKMIQNFSYLFLTRSNTTTHQVVQRKSQKIRR